MPLKRGAYYLSEAVDNLDDLIDRAKAVIRASGVQFDTVVGRGLSGALVVPALAGALGKNWVIVRKPGESSHDMNEIVGTLGERWLFVDDMVSSGETRQRCQEAIAREVDDANAYNEEYGEPERYATKYVGSYLYSYREVQDRKD